MQDLLKKLLFLFVLLSLAACQKESPQENAIPAEPELSSPAGDEGKVVTTMNAAGYTYVELEKDGKKFWVAGPSTDVKVGDEVAVGPGSAMTNFHSKSLDRTFESILFSGSITVKGAGSSVPGAQKATGEMAPSTSTSDAPAAGSIKKAQGGKTVGEIFAGTDSLNGKSVTVRGKIVKASGFIMNTNWYHIQDGTGEAGKNDLVVTSPDEAELGKVVVAKGTVHTNKDFGSGYRYDVIMEDAKLTVE